MMPDEDSTDITEQQIRSAVKTDNPAELVRHMAYLLCPKCGAQPLLLRHVLRRRAPDLYSRTCCTCANGHVEYFVFRVNWIKAV